MKPQIFDETQPLQEILVWGEPGIEALLGQLLPKSKSLFFSYYEVLEARNEFRNMRALVEAEGIKFTQAKDAFVRSVKNKQIPNEPKNIVELEKALLQRANEHYETYRENKIKDFSSEGIKGDIDQVFLQIQKEIKQILAEDIACYGEVGAIRLNYTLSLSQNLPLANIFYGRDQSQALTDKIILSALKWEIRKSEIDIFKEALIELGYADNLIQIQAGTLEGGDIVLLGDTCYVGVGARTSMSAVKNLCLQLGEYLEQKGIQIVAVVNKRHAAEAETHGVPTDEHMRIMHLDMFWIPLSPTLAMGYGHEIDQREVYRITMNSGMLITEDLGSFREFQAQRGIEILEISKEEQENFATNLLNLGNKTLIVALSTNTRVIKELEERGFRILSAELNKLVNGYGAVHCLSAPIQRKR